VFASSDVGATWSQLGAGQLRAGSMWTSIAAWTGCDGATEVYAGADQSSPDAIVRSGDGGATWHSVTGDPTKIHPNVGGPGGAPWWLSTRPGFMLGGKSSTPAQIALAIDATQPCADPAVLVAGRSGIWRSGNDGGDWYPMVGGMGVTLIQDLAVDPHAPASVDMVATDWTFLTSSDIGASVTSPVIKLAASTGFDVAIDSTSRPRACTSPPGTATATSRARSFVVHPAVAGSWTDEGSSALAGVKRPLATAVGKSGSSRVLPAAVDAAGIYRKVGTGN
jgi:hypothetical protein